ncbi:exported hypothetical protein [uncultured delta proteobacterium]|uniref:Uncharacterized protein n=1 Tax=uncultured delta proteobacterium TaxID=34034 RepID=A0A212IYB5_9DELT|nr:exported hypothetical protein [uncultured delta proteobacterium]
MENTVATLFSRFRKTHRNVNSGGFFVMARQGVLVFLPGFPLFSRLPFFPAPERTARPAPCIRASARISGRAETRWQAGKSQR